MTTVNLFGRAGRLLAALGILAALGSSAAHAVLLKNLSGTAITPEDADANYYHDTSGHTLRLCERNSVMCSLQRATAILELARSLSQGGALSADQFVSNVFEYVYKNIDTEFRFGLSKGAFGALLDQSGTPFDQAHLMVELLKEGKTQYPTVYPSIAPTYKVGWVTILGPQFAAWTGITSAQAACQLLANGGIR